MDCGKNEPKSLGRNGQDDSRVFLSSPVSLIGKQDKARQQLESSGTTGLSKSTHRNHLVSLGIQLFPTLDLLPVRERFSPDRRVWAWLWGETF